MYLNSAVRYAFLTQNASGQLHYFNFTATVNYVDEDRMVIVLPSADALLSIQATELQLGVQLYFDETSYRLMFEALGQVLKAKGTAWQSYVRFFMATKRRKLSVSASPVSLG